MSDLISREAVLNLVLPWCADDDGSVGKMGDLREVLDDIENLPSVELEEQEEAAVLKALKDVRTEIDTEYKKFRNKSDKWDERASGIGTALEIIDGKIAKVKKNEKGYY